MAIDYTGEEREHLYNICLRALDPEIALDPDWEDPGYWRHIGEFEPSEAAYCHEMADALECGMGPRVGETI